MRNWSKAFAVASLAASACVPALAVETPSPSALLDAVLTEPAVPYQGRVLVTQWFGKQERTEEMHVSVMPPDRIRREFLAPDGTVTRVSVSDGDVETVRLVRAGKTVVGNAVKSYEKVLPRDLERDVLLSNYDLAVSTAEKVAGRATWRLTMKPKIDGKVWQTLWVDAETKVVLRTRRFLPKRRFASSAQFVSFETVRNPDPALFQVDEATSGVIEARGLAPAFLDRAQLAKATGDATALPEKLPGGFVFESADVFPVGKSQVRHARYTDGLTVLSIFQTDRKVRLPKGGVIPPGGAILPGPLRASRAGKLIQWGSGSRYYTLMGDVSKELVADIIKDLR